MINIIIIKLIYLIIYKNIMLTTKEVSEIVINSAKDFSMKSVGTILPDMVSDCYMNVRTYLNLTKHIEHIRQNDEMNHLDKYINDNWQFNDEEENNIDLIEYQTDEVKVDLWVLFEYINNRG